MSGKTEQRLRLELTAALDIAHELAVAWAHTMILDATQRTRVSLAISNAIALLESHGRDTAAIRWFERRATDKDKKHEMDYRNSRS